MLITGVSGSGKSSLVQELRRRGFIAYDADDDGFTEPCRDGGAWAWRVEPIRDLLDGLHGRLVFFAGCSDEQAQFSFDYKVLLTAPVDVIVQRLRTRTTNSYGKSLNEVDHILEEMEWLVPLLQKSADLTVETTRPLAEVVDAVVAAVFPNGHDRQ